MNKKTLLSITLMMVLLAGLVGSNSARAQGLGNCENGYVSKVESPPFGLGTLPDGPIITKIIVKAGSQNQGEACFEFTQDGDNGCYSVLGFGTQLVHVEKIGDGPECKDISHVEFFADPESTPEPSLDPSPSASPSALPSASLSATPSAVPSPSPVASSTPEPSPVVNKPIEQQIEEARQEYIKEYGKEPEGSFK